MRDALRAVPGAANLAGYDTAEQAARAGQEEPHREDAPRRRQPAGRVAGAVLRGVDGRRPASRSPRAAGHGHRGQGRHGAARRSVSARTRPASPSPSFKKPTDGRGAARLPMADPRRCPAPGIIGVFDRSHYEDVLVRAGARPGFRRRNGVDATSEINRVRRRAGRRGHHDRQVSCCTSPTTSSGNACSRGSTIPTSSGSSTRATSRSGGYWRTTRRRTGMLQRVLDPNTAPWFVGAERPQVVPELGDHLAAHRDADDLDPQLPRADPWTSIGCAARLQPPN